MGSSEEEKLVQMVHDFMESDHQTPTNPSFSTSSDSLPLTTTRTHLLSLKNIVGNRTKAEREVVEAVLKHIMRGKGDHAAAENKTTTALKKWLVICLKMDGFVASLCHTSWLTSMGCTAGEYEYIDIKMQEDEEFGCGRRLIVDIDFKSQFEVARPSFAYRELTETLPSIFVGSEKKLLRIISILCSAAKQSLRESGLHLPPWRTTTYMQCKWLSLSVQQREKEEEEGDCGHIGFKQWMPPMVKKKQKRRVLDGGSALSTQFSNMSINCC